MPGPVTVPVTNLTKKGHVTIDYHYQYKCGLNDINALQRYFGPFALDSKANDMYDQVWMLRF